MKRLIQLNYILFFVFTYSFYSVCDNIVVNAKNLSSFWNSIEFSTKQSYAQEGFSASTLIQTSFGYKTIGELIPGDMVIDCNGEEKEVFTVTKHYVKKYIKLFVNDATICTGCDQLYYTSPVGIPIIAQNIKAGDILCNKTDEICEISSVELIQDKELLYCLTVKDHFFCIAPYNLCVHNAEAMIFGVSSICLGHIAIINPIITTVGISIALSTIAYKAYQEYIQRWRENDQELVLPEEVLLAERFYYTQRLNALEEIKQEFVSIKKDLENIKDFYENNYSNFTYQLLKQANIKNIPSQNLLLKISAPKEMQLSDKQKEDLRALREIELTCFEQEIVALQVSLAFHINELIEHVYVANKEYKKAKKEIDVIITLWNNNQNKMTDSIALQSYKADLLREHLLDNFSQKVNELKIVACYYDNCVSVTHIQQSTNIIDLLEKIRQLITEYDQSIEKEKACISHNISISELYFSNRGILVQDIKNETKSCLAKERKVRNKNAIAQARNKLTSIVVSGGPGKYPKKDDEPEKCFDDKKIFFKTAKEAMRAAKNLGFEKTNYRSQGQPVFKKDNRYITPDRTFHKGGVWKMADSVENLVCKTKRMGTYDFYLNRIGD